MGAIVYPFPTLPARLYKMDFCYPLNKTSYCDLLSFYF